MEFDWVQIIIGIIGIFLGGRLVLHFLKKSQKNKISINVKKGSFECNDIVGGDKIDLGKDNDD